MATSFNQRIVCLTEETVETLFLLGMGDKIVGASKFCVRPAEAASIPKVSTFLDAKFEEIEALEPDLVLGFSDLQADLAAELARRGLEVHLFNHRSIEEIYRMILMLSGMVGVAQQGEDLVEYLQAEVEKVRVQAGQMTRQPKVFFEEWDDPLISGIQWVSELVEIAGGVDVAKGRCGPLAKDRIWSLEEVAELNPELILVSWCGKKFRPQLLLTRSKWQDVPAVKESQVFEIPSEIILQPGPAALTDGLAAISLHINTWADSHPK